MTDHIFSARRVQLRVPAVTAELVTTVGLKGRRMT